MYITKIDIDMTQSRNYLGFADVGHFHSALENSFKGEREHPLWNITGNSIIMVSNRIPEISPSFGKSQTKSYNPSIPEGAVLHYHIVANPVISKNGKRIPLNVNKTKNHPYCAVDWLKDRLDKNGAQALTINVIKSENVKAKRGKAKFFAVTYEGSLVVRNKEKFEKALMSGIGHEKAYGCGLLLVKR